MPHWKPQRQTPTIKTHATTPSTPDTRHVHQQSELRTPSHVDRLPKYRHRLPHDKDEHKRSTNRSQNQHIDLRHVASHLNSLITLNQTHKQRGGYPHAPPHLRAPRRHQRLPQTSTPNHPRTREPAPTTSPNPSSKPLESNRN